MAKRAPSAKQLANQRRFAAASRARAAARRAPARKSSVPTKASLKSRAKSGVRRGVSAITSRANVRGALLPGAIAGAVIPYSPKVAGEYGPGLTMAVTGIASKNETLQTLGALDLTTRAVRNFASTAGPLAPASPTGLAI